MPPGIAAHSQIYWAVAEIFIQTDFTLNGDVTEGQK
jgi:hypothetical protein